MSQLIGVDLSKIAPSASGIEKNRRAVNGTFAAAAVQTPPVRTYLRNVRSRRVSCALRSR